MVRLLAGAAALPGGATGPDHTRSRRADGDQRAPGAAGHQGTRELPVGALLSGRKSLGRPPQLLAPAAPLLTVRSHGPAPQRPADAAPRRPRDEFTASAYESWPPSCRSRSGTLSPRPPRAWRGSLRTAALPGSWACSAPAGAERRKVRITYAMEWTFERIVWPLFLNVAAGHGLYLLAWDQKLSAVRSYRVERMRDALLLQTFGAAVGLRRRDAPRPGVGDLGPGRPGRRGAALRALRRAAGAGDCGTEPGAGTIA